jgi:hypothetical protein
MTIEEKITKLESLNCLKRLNNQRWFKLSNSNFLCFVDINGTIKWFLASRNPIEKEMVSFRKVLESVDEKSSEELIWNINFFNS